MEENSTRSDNTDRIKYNDIHEQTKECRGCERHEIIKVKNAQGDFVCPVCLVEDNL